MKHEKLRLILKCLLFVVAASWILHTFAKNFLVDAQFKKFLAEKTFEINASAWWFWILRVHIALAIIALLAAPFGFVTSLRRRNIKLHRLSGRIYVGSIFLNFVPSIYLSFFATGGVWSAIGFLLLNSIWAGATWRAYQTARRREIAAHQRWMIRSVAITLANLQLYVLKTALGKVAGFDFETAYTIAVWTCWIGGLLVAEIVIRRFAAPVAAPTILQIERQQTEAV